MRKFLGLGVLAVFSLFLPPRSQAAPLDIPTGGGPVVLTTTGTTTQNGYFVAKSTFSVALTTPPANYQYCISHVVVTAPSAGLFEMWWSTSTITAGTTDYMVQLAANTPYDTQWPRGSPYCAPPNDPLNLFLGVTGSTMTFEGYTFKGWNP